MPKKISARVLLALKDALAAIYWKKADLRYFIEHTIKNNAIVNSIDWNSNPKYESVSELIDKLSEKEDIYQDDLLCLCKSTCDFSDFSHLKKWDDSRIKIEKAKQAVENLRIQCKGHFNLEEEIKKEELRRIETNIRIKKTEDYRHKLEELKSDFINIVSNNNSQQRGYLFEKFLNILFTFFDLDPKSALKLMENRSTALLHLKEQTICLKQNGNRH